MTEQPDDQAVASNNRFEAIASASVDGLLVIDSEGIVLYANPAAVALFAEQAGDLVGFHFGLPAVREPTELQLPVKGEMRYVEMRTSEFTWNGREATLASLRDITDRKRTEEALRDSEQKFHTLVNQAPAALFLHAMDGYIVDYNQLTLQKYGYSADEIVNIKVNDIDPDYRERELGDSFWEELHREGQLQFEARHRRKDGTIFPVEVNLAPIEIKGKKHCLAMALDITERKQAEEALRESEALLSRSQELAHTGSWKLDLGTNRLTWSDEVYRIFGCKPQEFTPTYETFLDFVHPDDRVAVNEAYSRSQREKIEGYEIEHRLVQRYSGEVRHVYERCVHERDDAGTVIQSTGMIQDITDRKLSETYREMGREVLQILNEPGDPLESIRRVLDVFKTRTGVDAVGIRLQEGEDFPYFAEEGFPPDFLQTENTLVERDRDGGLCRDKNGNICLECTCGLVISGKTDPSNPLFTEEGSCWTNDSLPLLDLPSDKDPRRHPRNNCIHHGYASMALIPIRNKDRIVGLIQLNDKRKDRFTLETIQILEIIAAHIGSALMRKQAEKELRRLSTAIEQSPVAVVITDTKATIQYVNPTFEKMTGYTSKEAIGRNPRILKSGQQDAEFYTIMWGTLLDGKVWEGRMINKRKDGSFYTEDASIAPVKDNNGTITNYVGVKRDITQELKREEMLRQSQKMESVGQLAGGVAHDFNNMLMAIMGYAEMCRDEIGEDHPVREWIDEIMHGAERSAELTRQLLAFARKQNIRPVVLDLNDAVAGMLKMLRRLIGEGIDLAWEPGAELWSVKLDPGQVDQILANLCVNARDAIDGVGKVTIKTQNLSIDPGYCAEHPEAVIGPHVMLAVSDDGCGMDKKTLAQIFEPFYTTKGVGKGTGLGLATVYGIVKQNGGFVNVYSELGKGTTFRIYLPRFGGKQDDLEEAEKTKECPGGSATILLVEDEKSVLAITAGFLEKLGYTVLPAETPAAALRLAAEHEGAIDLLITDVVMPGMNGRDLAAKLIPDHPNMKILFMSGYTPNVIAHRGILDEGMHFLPKPFTRDDIARKVRELLNGK